jgi:geranylgeranyl reductase family protein
MTADVAVVGAGPSGAWAAYRLATLGARVTLLDPSHPREKPCGGGVTGRALSLVRDALGDRQPATVRIRRARFRDAAGGDTIVSLREDAGLIVASRSDFDGCLLRAARQAGARFVPSRAVEVHRHGRAFRVGTADGGSISAQMILGADGATSLVRRRLVGAFRRDQLSVATGFFARGVTGEDIVIEFTADPPGYIWSFPRPDHLAIGICAQADSGAPARALRAVVARWIRRAGLAPEASLRPYAWPIPTLSAGDVDRLAVAGPGWALLGDAAGLVDPITREGIFFALQSAELAAGAIAGEGGDWHRAYSQRVRDDIGSDLVRAARFKSGFFRPRFTRLLVDALRQSDGIRRVMADLVAGTQPYRGLKWRLLRTWELGLAWRALGAHLEK